MKLATALAIFAASVPAQLASTSPARELFILRFAPGPKWIAGLSMAKQNLGEHAAYHQRLVREGREVAAGGFVGVNGGMAIVRASNRGEVEDILSADPAIINGVFIAELSHWKPSFYNDQPLVIDAH